jgi:hypothetical protein
LQSNGFVRRVGAERVADQNEFRGLDRASVLSGLDGGRKVRNKLNGLSSLSNIA